MTADRHRVEGDKGTHSLLTTECKCIDCVIECIRTAAVGKLLCSAICRGPNEKRHPLFSYDPETSRLQVRSPEKGWDITMRRSNSPESAIGHKVTRATERWQFRLGQQGLYYCQRTTQPKRVTVNSDGRLIEHTVSTTTTRLMQLPLISRPTHGSMIKQAIRQSPINQCCTHNNRMG